MINNAPIMHIPAPITGFSNLAFNPLRFAVGMLIVCGVLIMALPLAMTAYMSLFADSVVVFPPSGYTLSWYGRLGEFPKFTQGLMVSLKVAAIATACSLTIGIPASIAIVRYKFFGRGVLNVLLLSPLTVPGVVIGLAIYVFMVEIEVTSGVPLIGSTFTLTVAHVLITTPWVVRLCVANLVQTDRAIEEAAANLGAHPFRVFWSVLLPSMRQGIVAAAVFSFIVSFENIEMTLFLISPGTITFPLTILQYLEYRYDPLVACVVVVQSVVVASLLLVIDHFIKLSKVV